MTELKCKWHAVVSLVGCIAEHHALVSGALFFRLLAFHAAVDIGTLCMNGRENAARTSIKHILSFGITDTLDGRAHSLAKFHIGLRRDFASQYDLAGGN